MNTRVLMSTSAALLGFSGLGATFLPQEILLYNDMKTVPTLTLFLQVYGALLLGFAMLNWTARGNLLGGIYSRPVTIGNFTHFVVGGLALTKEAVAHPIWMTGTLAVLYIVFAVSFAVVLFKHPAKVV